MRRRTRRTLWRFGRMSRRLRRWGLWMGRWRRRMRGRRRGWRRLRRRMIRRGRMRRRRLRVRRLRRLGGRRLGRMCRLRRLRRRQLRSRPRRRGHRKTRPHRQHRHAANDDRALPHKGDPFSKSKPRLLPRPCVDERRGAASRMSVKPTPLVYSRFFVLPVTAGGFEKPSVWGAGSHGKFWEARGFRTASIRLQISKSGSILTARAARFVECRAARTTFPTSDDSRDATRSRSSVCKYLANNEGLLALQDQGRVGVSATSSVVKNLRQAVLRCVAEAHP